MIIKLLSNYKWETMIMKWTSCQIGPKQRQVLLKFILQKKATAPKEKLWEKQNF